MALVNAPQQLGLFLGPILGGIINDAGGWRWVFWLSTITAGVSGPLLLIFRKTSPAAILRAKARQARKETPIATQILHETFAT